MKENFEPKLEKEKEPTVEDLYNACQEILGEDAEELKNFEDLDDAIGLCFSMLIENGVDDPEDFLRQKGILE